MKTGIPISEIDRNGDGLYDFEDWNLMIKDFGIEISPHFEFQIKAMNPGLKSGMPINLFDWNKDGIYDYEDFISTLKFSLEQGVTLEQIIYHLDPFNTEIFDFKYIKNNIIKIFNSSGIQIEISKINEEKIKAYFKRNFGEDKKIKEVLKDINKI